MPIPRLHHVLRPGFGLRFTLLATAAIALPTGTLAEDPFFESLQPSFNLYGTPGLIDMPSAEMAPDAELSSTVSHFAGTTRTTLSFQVLPRLHGSFRYTAMDGYVPSGYTLDTYYDRSFDLRYQLLDETKYRPAVSVGLQDFIGTGLYGGEYIVATKGIGNRLKVTAGLGWGRLGSHGSIATTGTRPTGLLGEGGVPTYDRWFRGDVAPFGGVEFKVNDRLTVKAEYSSDAYNAERGVSPASEGGNTLPATFDRKTSLNFGLDYRFRNGNQLSVYSLYGTEVGAMFTLHTNPKYSKIPGGIGPAPLPVKQRARADINDLGWTQDASVSQSARAGLRQVLAFDGLVYEGLELTGRSARLRLRNPKFDAEPQAIGRAARAMSRVLPASVETFTIIPMVNGVAGSAITVKRSDLEQLSNAPATALLDRAVFSDPVGNVPAMEGDREPRLSWSFSPYLALSVFDPDNPVRVDAGLRLQGDYYIAPNWMLSGSVAKKLAGNLDEVTRPIPSELPRVRTDYAQYSKEGDPAIEHLTLNYFGRPGRNLYSRATVGYLETMYGGLSGELLWKPVDSALALGAEVNVVRQRDFDQLFGFRDYQTTTGHVSAYYDFGNGFHAQVDAGRYLAGDYGATVSLDREFANGWRVGAYASFTDVSAEEYGEGSFDKGIRVTIPLSWALGTPTRKSNTVTVQSLTRDGAARVNVQNRLYERVRDYHRPEMQKEWGYVWR